ncbi:MAG TPA: MaoC family dehydratase [Candidatus Mediterraneibacter pullistercoris]|nr:MaoC family dehydratase [Candidatus Mediterraneibacter pullistercoris]
MKHYQYDEIKIGMEEKFQIEITEQMLDVFCTLTGDENPLHCDEEYAKEKGKKGRVAYGMLTASFLSTLAGMYLPGEKSLIQSVEVKFLKPVYIGDVLEIKGVVEEKHDVFQRIELKVTATRNGTEKVLKGKMKIGIE